MYVVCPVILVIICLWIGGICDCSVSLFWYAADALGGALLSCAAAFLRLHDCAGEYVHGWRNVTPVRFDLVVLVVLEMARKKRFAYP